MPDFRAHWNRYDSYSQNKTLPQICRCSRRLLDVSVRKSTNHIVTVYHVSDLVGSILHVSACDNVRLCLSKQDSGKMFSDLALVILALFVFVWGCMIPERRNNNSRERKSTGKPRKRKRVARNHWEGPHYMTQRKPEENTDDESYNMHWRIFRWDFLILIP